MNEIATFIILIIIRKRKIQPSFRMHNNIPNKTQNLLRHTNRLSILRQNIILTIR
ncbi:hypothetical protein Hanom_Chr09g00859381 [Helianthus anomalus]